MAGGIDDAAFQMIFQNQLGGVIQSFAYSRYLQQKIGTIPPLFGHFLNGADMAFDLGQPIDNLLAMFMRVMVIVRMILMMRMIPIMQMMICRMFLPFQSCQAPSV